jgi:hypothetical protein
VGQAFSDLAYLEQASVHAFRLLARELAVHGAPALLIAKALRAARDEVRHARVMRQFAERAGAPIPPVRLGTRSARPLKAIAIENAVEGCVRETLGAAMAGVQAVHAKNPQVRSAMARIARDETRHAELSWELARWLDSQLGPGERRLVRDAAAQSVDAIASSLGAWIDPAIARELGIPTSVQLAALFGALRESLWDPWIS